MGKNPWPFSFEVERNDTNLDSKIAPASGYPGAEEEATEAYILVRRGDDEEGNKVI